MSNFSWPVELQQRCHELVTQIVADGQADLQQGAWTELFALVAPWIEKWSSKDRLLRRAGLTAEDHWRAVVLDTVERLVRNRFRNLVAYCSAYQERQENGTLGPTPFEGWLRRAVSYAAASEVDRTLATRRMQPSGGAVTVEGLVEAAPRRSAITDLDIKLRSAAIRRAIAELPEEQKMVLVRRLRGESFAEIGEAVELSAEQAHALVRSAKARLRRSLRAAASSGPSPSSVKAEE